MPREPRLLPQLLKMPFSYRSQQNQREDGQLWRGVTGLLLKNSAFISISLGMVLIGFWPGSVS